MLSAVVAATKGFARRLAGMGQKCDALVLLVDDDDVVRRTAAHSLQRLGYQVVQADDGAAALEILQRGEYAVDLVLSDVRMPRLTGPELAHIVSHRWPNLPVLLTSGHARTGDFAERGRVLQVLPKPYSRAQLADAVAAVLS